ncbi:acyl carrier protein [Flavivirga rizhaonensis]|uniref:Acyl carrier protein n=1 Tax=Flavivirga rizhaonensis TaxID=2559571 RepID=A0A4S1E1U6_9FLAO|nr:acyl carrier protein [Flavivirga rizhaonensis]TGV03928.1 acyl carrier protein [Flavivirga rizhaonensis]
MTTEDIYEKIKPVFSKVLEHNNFELTESTNTNDVDGWGSLTHMIIIEEIEKVFNIKFKLLDLMTMENVGDLVNAIKSSTD